MDAGTSYEQPHHRTQALCLSDKIIVVGRSRITFSDLHQRQPLIRTVSSMVEERGGSVVWSRTGELTSLVAAVSTRPNRPIPVLGSHGSRTMLEEAYPRKICLGTHAAQP